MQTTDRIRNQKDFAAGVIYVLLGSGFALGAFDYKIGEAARMGPGWFPLAIGLLLALVGLLTAGGALRRGTPVEKVKTPELGPMLWILGAVVLFGLLLNPLGLVLALFVLVVVASRGSHEFTWRSAILTAIVLIAFSCAVFIYGINLQLPLWPTFLR